MRNTILTEGWAANMSMFFSWVLFMAMAFLIKESGKAPDEIYVISAKEYKKYKKKKFIEKWGKGRGAWLYSKAY
jgi:hypothetical protein